jgi:hypothetical protein
MNTLEIFVALLRGMHVAAVVSLFGTLVFLTLVVPSALAEAATEAPHLRRRLLRLARISAVLALALGIAWLTVESAVIAAAGSAAMTLHAVPVVALRTQFGQWLLVRGVVLLVVLSLLRPWRACDAIAAVLAAIALAIQPMLGHAGALGGSIGTTLIISEVLHLLAAGAWLGQSAAVVHHDCNAAAQRRGNGLPQLHAGGSLRGAGAGGNRRGAGSGIHGRPAGTVWHRLWPGRAGEARAFCCVVGTGRAQSVGAHRSPGWSRVRRRTAPHADICRRRGGAGHACGAHGRLSCIAHPWHA